MIERASALETSHSRDLIKQPRLMDEWGCEFFGQAKTITGDFWWYEQDRKRYPLLPLEGVKCARP